MQKVNMRSPNGFTMMELSIVLVIMGLLAGGALYGAGMIQGARDQKVAQEMASYDQAVTRFYEQYAALPGDMPRARTYWDAQCGGAACNGDGDRLIQWGAGEGTKAWQHLSLAKMVNGIYDGNGATGDLGINIPRSDYVDNAGYYFYDDGETNFLGLAKETGTPGAGSAPALTPETAMRIDTKMDDGVADTGILRGLGADCAAGSAYNALIKTFSCELALELKVLNR